MSYKHLPPDERKVQYETDAYSNFYSDAEYDWYIKFLFENLPYANSLNYLETVLELTEINQREFDQYKELLESIWANAK